MRLAAAVCALVLWSGAASADRPMIFRSSIKEVKECAQELRETARAIQTQFPDSDAAAQWSGMYSEIADDIERRNKETETASWSNLSYEARRCRLRLRALQLERKIWTRRLSNASPDELDAIARFLDREKALPLFAAFLGVSYPPALSVRRGGSDADFDRELRAGVEELIETGRKFASEHPESSAARALENLLSGVGRELLDSDYQMRINGEPPETRAPKLRKQYLDGMRQTRSLKTAGSGQIRYNERESAIVFISGQRRRSRKTIAPPLQVLLRTDLDWGGPSDPFALELQDAVDELNKIRWLRHSILKYHLRSGAQRPAKTRFAWLFKPASPYDRIDDIMHVFEDAAYELTAYDTKLAAMRLSREERAAKLRQRFFETAAALHRYKSLVQYDEAAFQVNFLDRDGAPAVAQGKPVTFDFPPELIALLDLSKGPAPQGGIPAGAVWTGVVAAALIAVLFLLLKPGRNRERAAQSKAE